jgi:hypothetical protein
VLHCISQIYICLFEQIGVGHAVSCLKRNHLTQHTDPLWTSVYHGKQSDFHFGISCELDSVLENDGGVAEDLAALRACFAPWVWGGEAWRGESNERELSLNQMTEPGKSQWIVIQRLLSHSQHPILYLSRLQRIELNQNKSNIIQQPAL